LIDIEASETEAAFEEKRRQVELRMSERMVMR
jgi:hypothetical protein